MPKPNEYIKMLLTNNTIESKHLNRLYHNGETQMAIRRTEVPHLPVNL